MTSSTSGASHVSAKNRPTEYRRNWIGSIIICFVLTSFVGYFLSSIYYTIVENNPTEVLILKIVLILGYALVVINLGLALAVRGFGMKIPYLKYLLLLFSAIIIPTVHTILFAKFSNVNILHVVFSFIVAVALSVLYAGMCTSNTQVLGRNLQPWYIKTPLVLSNIEVGRSVSMLRFASGTGRSTLNR